LVFLDVFEVNGVV